MYVHTYVKHQTNCTGYTHMYVHTYLYVTPQAIQSWREGSLRCEGIIHIELQEVNQALVSSLPLLVVLQPLLCLYHDPQGHVTVRCRTLQNLKMKHGDKLKS